MKAALTRRNGIAAVLMGLVSASCASANPAQGRRISFQDTLAILNSVATLSEFESAVGRSGLVEHIVFNDADNDYRAFRRGRDDWGRLYVLRPSDIMENIPVGTKMVSFEFLFNQPINPTRGRLFLCVEENDRIIGWLYSRTLIGHEREAMPAW